MQEFVFSWEFGTQASSEASICMIVSPEGLDQLIFKELLDQFLVVIVKDILVDISEFLSQ